MQRKRISVYVGQPVRDLLEAHRAGEEGGREISSLINTVADRYNRVVAAHLPSLTREEWAVVMDALNGAHLQADAYAQPPRWAIYSVMDLIADGGAERHGADAEALKAKLSALDEAGIIALIDAAERFWAREDASVLDELVGQG